MTSNDDLIYGHAYIEVSTSASAKSRYVNSAPRAAVFRFHPPIILPALRCVALPAVIYSIMTLITFKPISIGERDVFKQNGSNSPQALIFDFMRAFLKAEPDLWNWFLVHRFTFLLERIVSLAKPAEG